MCRVFESLKFFISKAFASLYCIESLVLCEGHLSGGEIRQCFFKYMGDFK